MVMKIILFSTMINSSPYITEEEQRILKEKENEKHFLNHKDFIFSVGHYSMKLFLFIFFLNS